MKVVCNQQALAQGLSRVVPAAATRNTMPILSHVLIRGRGKALELVATDLQIGMESRVEAEIVDGGGITVPARKIFDIVREIPAGQVQISVDEGGRVSVKSGSFSCRIVALPEEEFPVLPAVDETRSFEMDPALLVSMVHKTSFAVSQDETRMNLTGIYLKTETGSKDLEMVATDSHRLALARHQLAQAAPMSLGVLVPRKAMEEVARLAAEQEEPVKITAAQTHAKFNVGPVTVLARLIEGKFPPYSQVIPKESQRRLLLNREEFLSATRRIQHLAVDRSNSVKYELGAGKVTLKSSTADVGDAVEEVKAQLQGTPISVAYNSRFIIEGLKVFQGEEIQFGFTDSVGPSTLTSASDPSYLYIVMPMRI